MPSDKVVRYFWRQIRHHFLSIEEYGELLESGEVTVREAERIGRLAGMTEGHNV